METMQALVSRSVGEPADVLQLETRPVPEAGPGQVRVRVHATPVHPTDLHIARGRYGFAPVFPAVLGMECVGTVDALGEGVESLAVGQRVVTVGITGTWQQYLVADAGRVLAVPDTMSASTAAQLVTNPLTAVLLVTRELTVAPGEWLLQTAAASTVGRLVVQDLVERVTEIVGDEGVSKAIDCVAGQVGADVARSLAAGGEMVVYGALSTHRKTDVDDLKVPLPANALIYGTKALRGFWLYRWFTTTPQEQIGAALSQTFELVANGTVEIPEGRPLPVERFADAVRLAEAPGHGGKPLLLFEG